MDESHGVYRFSLKQLLSCVTWVALGLGSVRLAFTLWELGSDPRNNWGWPVWLALVWLLAGFVATLFPGVAAGLALGAIIGRRGWCIFVCETLWVLGLLIVPALQSPR